jgi:hypothetical protein
LKDFIPDTGASVQRINQDGQILWNCVLSLPIHELAALISLIEETTFLTNLEKKGRSLIGAEDRLNESLKKRTEELQKEHIEFLVLKLFGCLGELAEICEIEFPTRRSGEIFCAQVVEKALIYKSESDKNFEGETLMDLVRASLLETLEKIQEDYKNLDPENQAKVTAELLSIIEGLPEDQQNIFLEKANIDEITEDTVKSALLTGTIGLAFGSLVSISGFAFYTTATSALAGVAGLVGITLPFAAYTMLTSAIAVASSLPVIIGIVSAISLGGLFKGKIAFQKNLLSGIVVKIVATAEACKDYEAGASESAVLAAWQSLILQHRENQNTLEILEQERPTKQDLKKQQIKISKEANSLLSKELKNTEDLWNELRKKALHNAAEIEKGNWGHNLSPEGNVLSDLVLNKKAIALNPDSSLFDMVKEKVAEVYDDYSRNQQVNSSLDSIIDTIKTESSKTSYVCPASLSEHFFALEALSHNTSEHRNVIRESEQKKTHLDEAIVELDRKIVGLSDTLSKREQTYWIIKHSSVISFDPKGLQPLVEFSDSSFENQLKRPITSRSLQKRMQSLVSNSGDDSVFGTVVVADFLYDYLRLDPTVMEGVDFASSLDLSSPFSFALFAAEQTSLMAEGGGDSIHRLKGYVAERLVAHNLSAAGHDVSFPEASNQAGYDLLVDGQPFQVKCTSSPEHVLEHLESYPEIPVIVNSELAEILSGTPGVYIDAALSNEEATKITEEGLQSGADLLDLEIPWIAMAISASVEIKDLYHSRTGFSDALINIASDTAGRTVLGIVCANAVAATGAIFFGPAGAVIGNLTGGVFGGVYGKKVAQFARRHLPIHTEQVEKTRIAARNLAKAAAFAIPLKINAWTEKKAVVENLNLDKTSHNPDVRKLKQWLLFQTQNDIHYFEYQKANFQNIANETSPCDPIGLSKRVLDLIGKSAIHPHRLQTELKLLFTELKKLNEIELKNRTQ